MKRSQEFTVFVGRQKWTSTATLTLNVDCACKCFCRVYPLDIFPKLTSHLVLVFIASFSVSEEYTLARCNTTPYNVHLNILFFILKWLRILISRS